MLNLRLALLGMCVLAPAAAVGAWTAARAGLTRAIGSDVAWWGLTAFVVGARAGWLMIYPGGPGYPLDAIRITQGLYTPAGLPAAALAVVVLAARRGVGWRALAGPAAAAGLAAAAGWHATCALQSRCGGMPAGWPLGWQLGGADPQLPVAPALAVCAAVLAWFTWRRAGALSARLALLAAAAYVALVAASGTVALRLAPWPSSGDVGFALGALGLAAWAAAARTAQTARPPAPNTTDLSPSERSFLGN